MTALTDPASPAAGADVICLGLAHIYAGEEAPIVALRNVELAVRAGELLALLGPSGSGKSTLLAVLSGLLRPTAGSVLVAGHDLARLDERGLSRLRATELALLLQDPLQNLVPYATPLENFAFAQRGARRRGWPLRWTPEELAETFGLQAVAQRPVYGLSGGEQQKVATAAAIATSPRVLVADEPTTSLDPSGRDAVIDALRRAHELSGATVIVATHDSITAAAFPRTVTISHGMIGEEGRGGRRFAIVGRDGAVQLPAEVLARHPAGSLLQVRLIADGVELRSDTPGKEERSRAEPGPSDHEQGAGGR
jgi:putative ABC transport system ATP-binding protein